MMSASCVSDQGEQDWKLSGAPLGPKAPSAQGGPGLGPAEVAPRPLGFVCCV